MAFVRSQLHMHIGENSPSLGPNVIGATGGSGTRVFARIVRRGGMFIGHNLNDTEDSLDISQYLDRWINEFMPFWDSPSEAPARDEMSNDLKLALENHRSPLASQESQPWGWKDPRSIYLLPLFHSHLPSMKFLHVIRDGRDMAYSSNQNQLRKHGHTLLELTEDLGSQPLQSIALWSRINLMAADYGEKHLGGHYLRVRFEDLCADPGPTVLRVFEFFGLQGDTQEIAELEVSPPGTLGRWRREPSVAEVSKIGLTALRRFGYVA